MIDVPDPRWMVDLVHVFTTHELWCANISAWVTKIHVFTSLCCDPNGELFSTRQCVRLFKVPQVTATLEAAHLQDYSITIGPTHVNHVCSLSEKYASHEPCQIILLPKTTKTALTSKQTKQKTNQQKNPTNQPTNQPTKQPNQPNNQTNNQPNNHSHLRRFFGQKNSPSS